MNHNRVPLDILETLLGLRVNAARNELTLDPWLPAWLEWIEVDGLRVGESAVSLRVSGHHDAVDVGVIANPAEVSVVRVMA